MTPREQKQAQLSASSSGSAPLVIPKVPSIPIPARVASAFPELKTWHDETTAETEKWRVQTSIAVLGVTPVTPP